MRISKRWLNMSKWYEKFALDNIKYKDSEEDKIRAYIYESEGIGEYDPLNLWMNGKHWMDATAAMWKEDLGAKIIFPYELLAEYPYELLERLVGFPKQGSEEYKEFEERYIAPFKEKVL